MKFNRNKIGAFLTVLFAAGSLSFFTMCKGGGGKADSTAAGATINILGAGSSFVNPLFTKMFSDYNQKTGVRVNYQSIGSGGGIQQLTSKTVDFGASDAFLNDEKMAAMPAPVIHIPVAMGAVVLSYNIPGVTEQLNFTGEVVANIFLGKIKKWDDAAIKKLNPTSKLPATDIIIAHRADGSGTTAIFTDYLSKVSDEWKSKVGMNTSVTWPVGLGGKGNEGVSGLIKQTPGCIGYVELIYAMQNNISYGKVLNKSGNNIVPSLAAVVSAGNTKLPDDMRFSITNTDAADGYPISGTTWALMYKEQKYNNRTLEQATALVKLLWWVTHEGQAFNEPLNYAKVPATAVTQTEALLKSVTYDGKPILQ
ncbi:MAG TPA: phosphate ABC transporter substrate-binding protein PstS [Candidatus Kapabacteria bacterium]|nr:phosphate ABC transporter substrate-binding protein PstS [Candidatus Kapabacteria bacterium]